MAQGPGQSVSLEQFLRRRRLRQWWLGAGAVLVLALVAAADHAGLLLYRGSDWQRFHGKTFAVRQVIDGDTIELDEPEQEGRFTRVRLWGVDCPEMERTREGIAAQPFAREATALAHRLCDNQQVRIELEPQDLRDRYGRLIAFVILPDGRVFNEELLTAGLARADQRFSHSQLQHYQALEQQARTRHLAMWQEKPSGRKTRPPASVAATPQ